MPYTDLSSLMQVAPYAAAGMASQAQAQDQQSELLRQQELAQLISSRTQDQQFAAQKQPLALQQMQLANDTTSANLPGLQADSAVKAGTVNSDIAAKNNSNNAQLYATLGAHFGAIANNIRDLPDIQKPAAFAKSVQDLGLPPTFTQNVIQRYSQYAPSQLADKLDGDSEKLLKFNPQYATTTDSTNAQASARIQETRMNNESAERVANIGANAKIQAAQTRIQQIGTIQSRLNGAHTPEAQYGVLLDGYAQLKDTDPDLAQNYLSRALTLAPLVQARTANGAPKPGSVNTTELGVPTNPPQSVLPPGVDTPPQQAPATPSFQTNGPTANVTHSLAQVQRMYPGVPLDKLREAYRAKYGVNLQ